MKTGDRDTEDTGTPRDPGTPPDTGENVVRLPREWIGPLEELVPIRPADSARRDDGDSEDAPPTADAFWSEDAGALHNAVQAPVEARHDPAGRKRRRWWSTVGRPRRLDGVRLRYAVVAAVAVSLLVMAVIGSVWGSGGGRPAPAGHHSSTQAAAVSPGKGQNLDHRRLPSAARARSGARAASERGSTQRAAREHHRASGGHALVRRSAATGPAQSSGALGRTSGSTAPAPVAPGTRTTSPAPATYAPPPAQVVANPTSSAPQAGPASSPSGSSGTAASSSGTPAFGSSGALGPGSSPNS